MYMLDIEKKIKFSWHVFTLSSLVLITFTNSLDLDQARQNFDPDLDPNCLTLWWYN